MDPGLDDGRAAVCFGLGISQQFSRTRGFLVGRRQIRMGTASSPLQRLIQRAASAYIAGPTIASARAVCDRLASLGIASAVCYWNRPTDSPLFTTQCYVTPPEAVDRTFVLIEAARRMYPNLGCTLPSRWRRSLDGADRALEWNLRIRLVKGEWPGPNGDEMDPSKGILQLVERLTAKG